MPKPSNPPVVFTIGHSTRKLEAFTKMLQAHGVRQLIDVRTIPRSRHNPQFNRDELPRPLRAAKIRYVDMPELGGLRRAKRDSINTGWRNASFRGFADYMQTPEFEKGLQKLLELSRKKPSAIMCAEAVPWRCHRSLIADALTARGVAVEHLMSATSRHPHSLTPFARLKGKRVTYPGKENATPRSGVLAL